MRQCKILLKNRLVLRFCLYKQQDIIDSKEAVFASGYTDEMAVLPLAVIDNANPEVSLDDDLDFEDRENSAVLPSQACPVCHYKTLGERGSFEVCVLCGWEDDGCDEMRASEVFGGPNGQYSLDVARSNFNHHLTIYSPADTYLFRQMTEEVVLFKKESIAIGFEERDLGPNEDKFLIDFDAIFVTVAQMRIEMELHVAEDEKPM